VSGAGALALDLGTTQVKLARLDARGELELLGSTAAPEPSGAGAVREVDPLEYARAAEELLAPHRGSQAEPVPLAIACQRSSFLLWERSSGTPLTPIVSWQDRRAAPWCERHAEREAEVKRSTGLPLSPHYAGPKLAWLFERDSALARRAGAGELAFGTLETWLAWRWSGGAAHVTDISMAARTLLVDLASGGWSDALLGFFGVPSALLPEIAPSAGRSLALEGFDLRASLSDQAAGVLAVLRPDEDGALVNFGTGSFVLRPSGERRLERPGYLTGPLCGGARTLYALEGTINAGGATAARFAEGPTELPAADRAPNAFCLPDENGVGAPHWLPSQGFALSAAARELLPVEQRRIVLEGLVFRARAQLADLGTGASTRILLGGGLTRDPFVAAALAAVLGREVELLETREATLLGAARLAAGLHPCADPRTRRIEPPAHGSWLREKYPRWLAWLAQLLRPPGGAPRPPAC
jgi:glycerol kinase